MLDIQLRFPGENDTSLLPPEKTTQTIEIIGINTAEAPCTITEVEVQPAEAQQYLDADKLKGQVLKAKETRRLPVLVRNASNPPKTVAGRLKVRVRYDGARTFDVEGLFYLEPFPDFP